MLLLSKRGDHKRPDPMSPQRISAPQTDNLEGNRHSHLSTLLQRQAVKLLSCCLSSVKLQGENAKLRQELEKLR